VVEELVKKPRKKDEREKKATVKKALE